MEQIFWTIKDEEGVFRPMVMICSDKMKKYAQPEFDKLLKRGHGESLKMVKVKIEEIT